MELGSESFVDNWELKNDLKNFAFNEHDCFSSMRILGDFSNRGCMSVREDCCGALKRPHSCVQAIFDGLRR